MKTQVQHKMETKGVGGGGAIMHFYWKLEKQACACNSNKTMFR